jgi:hypothetical protein
MVIDGRRVLADLGSRDAIAPGVATVKRGRALAPLTVNVSVIEASGYARDLASQPNVEVVVREGGRILSATRAIPPRTALASRGSVTLGGSHYRAVTGSFAGFGVHRVDATVLSNPSATSAPVGTSRTVAVVFVAFLVLAFSSRCWPRARCKARSAAFSRPHGDWGADTSRRRSRPKATTSSRALVVEFNNMSSQLATRLDQLSQVGSAFASRFRASVRRSPRTSIGPRCSNLRHASLPESCVIFASCCATARP